MEKKTHIIWGDSSLSKNRINLLKMNGMEEIFVLDKEQSSILKEENDVVYFSLKFAPLLMKDSPGKVHHLFMYIPPGAKNRIKKDETNP
ncbi:hypothetical protein [Sporosarcina pasteurii]|uniref:Uncharacterized protein n=1 Tax=Sporosarcina pasteurii TaxID=1474 RepID=A0A380BDK2_SPOPA|nr:hypothetical protein [Sporosarcina pasteurii]MDS9472438.1 hypothetical protein [Sporosarcina pasteurii]QBQ05996.1 hypothetical protein E2C16_10100 [Sporosarcina pasteurii]SUI99707.1 Uncharacterised protein [Sporosarcina pasteurii]